MTVSMVRGTGTDDMEEADLETARSGEQLSARELRRADPAVRSATLRAAAEASAEAYQRDPELNVFAALEGEPFVEDE